MIGIDPGYFLDEMSQDELIAICDARNKQERITWEQVRAICYWSVVAQRGNKEFPKPEKLFRFPWEKKNQKASDSMTSDQAREWAYGTKK